MSNNNTKIDGRIRVCTRISLSAECPEDIDEDKIGWKVKIDKEEFRLEDLKKNKTILGEDAQVSCKDISFVVPKEWGQKTVTIIAYLQEDETQLVNKTYQVLDHIVAAFYRIDVDKPKTFKVDKIKGGGGTTNTIDSDPVYHNQGMYKDEATGNIYVSVSVNSDVHPYIYILEEDKTKKGEYLYKSIIRFNEDYKNYRHPGGIQTAKNMLAVGFEKYGPLDLGTVEESVISFFDITESDEEEDSSYTEYANLRVLKDKKNTDVISQGLPQNNEVEGDWASAVGIIWIDEPPKSRSTENISSIKSKYLVVSRGASQGIDFYLIDEFQTSIQKIGKKIDHVGEFQNVNLIQNELGEIYMVGFESRKKPLGTGSKTNFVWIYQLDITDKEIYIKPIWINEEGLIERANHHIIGYIKATMYTEEKILFEEGEPVDIGKNKPILFDKNSRQVTTQSGASFQWASCIYADKTKQNELTGFMKKLTMYAVSSVAQYTESTDETYEDYRQNFYYNKNIIEAMNLSKSDGFNGNIDQWDGDTTFMYEGIDYMTIEDIISEWDHYPNLKEPISFAEYRYKKEQIGGSFDVNLNFNAFT